MPLQVGHLSREVWPRLPGTLSHAPMVLLVNRSTASASEVLAGALHDNGRSVWSRSDSDGRGGRGSLVHETLAARQHGEVNHLTLHVTIPNLVVSPEACPHEQLSQAA